MVGDNPESDIKGANAAGGKWKSVLVRTGVFDEHHKENHDEHPAVLVADHVGHALELIHDHQRK